MSAEERRLPPRFVPTLTEVLPPEPQHGGLDLELPLDHWAEPGPAVVEPPIDAPMVPAEPIGAAAEPEPGPEPEPVPSPVGLTPQAQQDLVQAIVDRVMHSVEAELPEALELALAQVRDRLAAAAWAALLAAPDAGAAPAPAPGPAEGGFEQFR